MAPEGCYLYRSYHTQSDDTASTFKGCYKAKYPIREDLLKALNMHDKGITTAAICVYPARVCDAVKALKAAGCDIPVASVATGFQLDRLI